MDKQLKICIYIYAIGGYKVAGVSMLNQWLRDTVASRMPVDWPLFLQQVAHDVCSQMSYCQNVW